MKIFLNKKHHLLLVIIAILSHLPFLAMFGIKPEILLSSVFFFCLFPAYEFSYTYLVILGLICDVIQGTIIGISSLQFMFIAMVTIVNRKALLEQKFYIVWLTFLIILIGVLGIKATFYSSINSYNYFNLQLLLQTFITFLFYPVLHILYYRYSGIIKKDA